MPARAQGDSDVVSLKLLASDPLNLARAFYRERYQEGAYRTIHWHAGGWHLWDGVRYREVAPEDIQGQVWGWLEMHGITPNRKIVAEVMAALQAVACLPSTITLPCWLTKAHQAAELPPGRIAAFDGGLIDLDTREVFGPTPAYFNHAALGTSYTPDAPPPHLFLGFLDEIFDGDAEAISTLQEMFGYLIAGLTFLQKAFLLVGPRRSGKGTLLRVLRALCGSETVVGPTLSTLSGTFGLESLVYKTVAVIGDARISSRSDWAVVAERILMITGEDLVTVERKFRPSWTGKLPTRFVIATNELPRLSDASSALVGRFVVLVLRRSWYGKEDPTLSDRLLQELPSILLWSLAGLARLRRRGHFVLPSTAVEAVQQIEDISSPISAFLRDECDTSGPDKTCIKAHLYERWRDWCHEHGYPRPGSEAHFGRDLRAALPLIQEIRPTEAGERIRKWAGIELRPRQYREDA